MTSTQNNLILTELRINLIHKIYDGEATLDDIKYYIKLGGLFQDLKLKSSKSMDDIIYSFIAFGQLDIIDYINNNHKQYLNMTNILTLIFHNLLFFIKQENDYEIENILKVINYFAPYYNSNIDKYKDWKLENTYFKYDKDRPIDKYIKLPLKIKRKIKLNISLINHIYILN